MKTTHIMQNKDWAINSIRFFLLLLMQVLLFNHINFLGYINPYIYIAFILFFPFTAKQTLLIFSSFVLGLSIDIFSDSEAIHAAASVFIAYLRPSILKISFGVSYQHNSVHLNQARFSQIVTYVATMVIMHHLMLFTLDVFNLLHILLILKSTLFSGIFTVVLIVSSIVIFSKNKNV